MGIVIDFVAARARLRPKSRPFNGPQGQNIHIPDGAAVDLVVGCIESNGPNVFGGKQRRVVLSMLVNATCVYQMALEPHAADDLAIKISRQAARARSAE
jgi:hypothetical protein